MLILSFFRWWYGPGWLELAKRFQRRLRNVAQTFSVGLLLSTLFAPWKQIVTGKDPNATIGDKGNRLLDNLISRLIGFWVRLFTLVASLFVTLITTVFGLATILVWPAVPVIYIWLVVRGLGL